MPAASASPTKGETVIAWDAESGEPVCNAIVWQDARTLPLHRAAEARRAPPS